MADRGVRSAKGVLVDFDLIKIKQQMSTAPKPVVVEARENFIDNKFKRQLKKQVRDAIELATDDILSKPTEQLVDIKNKPDNKLEPKTPVVEEQQ